MHAVKKELFINHNVPNANKQDDNKILEILLSQRWSEGKIINSGGEVCFKSQPQF